MPTTTKYQVGDKIKFEKEKQRYTIQARDDRYIIATKPFNARHTVIYTIIDLKRGVRGPDNLVFGLGYESRLDCENALVRLQDGSMEVSHRRLASLEPSELQALTAPAK